MDSGSSRPEGVPRGDGTLSQEQDLSLNTFNGDIASLLRDTRFQRKVYEYSQRRCCIINSRLVAELVSPYAVFYVLDKLSNSADDPDFIISVVSEMVQNVVVHGSQALYDCPEARIDCADDGDFVVITTIQSPLEKDTFDELKARIDGLQVQSAVADRITSSQVGEPLQVGGMGLVVIKGLLEERGGTLSISQDDKGLHFCARIPRVS